MDEQQIKMEIVEISDYVKSIVIIDRESLEMAQDAAISNKNLQTKIWDYWDDMVRKADAAHKALTKNRGEMFKPVKNDGIILTNKISVYLTAQEKIRLAEQARIDAEREKKEQKEREKLERRADKAIEKGQDEKAEELLEKAEQVFIPPSIVKSEIEKTSRTDAGTMSQSSDIKVTITDKRKLVESITTGKVSLDIITVNETKLKRLIKLNQWSHVPGCVIEPIIKPAFRRAK